MAFLLRHRPEVGGLTLNSQGWATVDDLCLALEKLLKFPVSSPMIEQVVIDSRPRRFELHDSQIRAIRREQEKRDQDQRRVQPPDILYHATTADQIEKIQKDRSLSAGSDRHVFLSADESQAWRVAHRLHGTPVVLYVDAARARRHGVRFFRNRRNGLYLSSPVPVADILNLQEGFAEQISAGGIPVSVEGEEPRVALIRVSRKSGVTWEVAKGKLEHGEPPEVAAVREVQEEMGVSVDLKITRSLGIVRYGFLAPGGLPRLKTVHLYLMEPDSPMHEFLPASAEGIAAVRWFSLEDAAKAVTHSSLIPLMRKACAVLAAEPGSTNPNERF